MYLSNMLSQIVTIHVRRSRNGNQYCYGKVLVLADICIVRERVWCHSMVVGDGSQIKTL